MKKKFKKKFENCDIENLNQKRINLSPDPPSTNNTDHQTTNTHTQHTTFPSKYPFWFYIYSIHLIHATSKNNNTKFTKFQHFQNLLFFFLFLVVAFFCFWYIHTPIAQWQRREHTRKKKIRNISNDRVVIQLNHPFDTTLYFYI